MFTLKIKRNGLPKEIELPSVQYNGDAGLDLKSAKEYIIEPHDNVLVDTGIQIEIPEECVGLVCPRSGLAKNSKITVLNSPGIIDSSYRGNIGVILMNHGDQARRIRIGDRIAQLCITVIPPIIIREVEKLSETERGENGFGSTGIF